MSTLFPGGIRKVEWDDNVGFTSPTEIPGIMKESKVEPGTDTEEDGLGKPVSAGKKVNFTLITEDMTQNTWLPEIQAAEAAHSEGFLRITGMKATQNLILKSVKVYTHLQPVEAGKNWKRAVGGGGYADSEANLLALTLA